MGNWVIYIEGTGGHHNDMPYDAERIAREFVEKLKGVGQNVEHATFIAGGRDIIQVKD